MSKYIINGGIKLKGTVKIAGNKNAVLPIMAATILADGPVTLTNVPAISDVVVMSDILRDLGATVNRVSDSVLTVDAKNVTKHTVNPELSKKLRASVLLMGPLFARFGKVVISHPGGDVIGKRSIDTHLDGFRKLGAKVTADNSTYRITRTEQRKEKLTIFLDEPSVTATENLLMASVKGKHEAISLENITYEPHIMDLISFLTAAGADISVKNPQQFVIAPVVKISGTTHPISPDYVEAGTFICLAAATKSDITITGCRPDDLKLPLQLYKKMGLKYAVTGTDTIRVYPSVLQPLGKTIQAGVHPNFPTDLMSPMIVMATQINGETLFHDPLYESRMFFTDKLTRMGAKITLCDPHRAIVIGPTNLNAQHLFSPDIRAGMALVIASLVAKGESIIENAEIVERGYERLPERLSALGASIEKHE